jgi:hypothetical protein
VHEGQLFPWERLGGPPDDQAFAQDSGIRERPGVDPAFKKVFARATTSQIENGRLDFGVGVRANFAVQFNFFVLRCGPFHGYDSLVLVKHGQNNTEVEEQKAELAPTKFPGTKTEFPVTNKKRKEGPKSGESQRNCAQPVAVESKRNRGLPIFKKYL